MASTTNSISARLQNINFKTIPQRCAEIENIIKSSGPKELRTALPQLLENIFGFGCEAGWGLDVINRSASSQDFEYVRRLLAPEGPILMLVYTLQADPYLSYEFPFSCLPAPTRHLIEDGGMPIFYANKIQYQSYGRPVIALNAFECYMFYFAFCLVTPQWQRRNVSWTILTDCLYPCLLDDYLVYFLPPNKDSLPSMPMASSPARNPVMHSSFFSSKSPTPTPPKSTSRPGLLKSSFLTAHKQHNQTSPSLTQGETETYRSETLVQVLAELWLNQNTVNVEKQTLSSTPSNFYIRHGHPFDVLHEHFLPSNNHVRLVRMMIKHLHSFSNSANHIIVTSPYQSHMVSPLDEFKKSIFPHILQKKLYSFLRHGFDRWPLDCSFRIVLETWLTYIQPWRYLPTNKQGYGPKSGRRHSDTDSKTIEEKWFPFVEGNLLFYTVLFQEFIVRLFRMDLTTLFNASMLFRASKVFSLPNLSNMIQRAERELCSSFRNGRPSIDLGGSYLSPETSLSLHTQISELEKPKFQYCLMYSEDTMQIIRMILKQIELAKMTIASAEQTNVKPQKSGLAAFFDISSWFDGMEGKGFGDLSLSEVKKLRSYLDSSTKNLCYIFEIPPPEYVLDRVTSPVHFDQSSFLNASVMSSGDKTPDHLRTDEGIRLTSLGRKQVMNKMKQFDICYQGDPDLQPIRSYENATTVRLLYHFCNYINTQYGDHISKLCNRQDIIGRISRVLFCPPLSPNQKVNSPIPSSTRQVLEQPRLSLRFLASYRTMMYLVFLYFVMRLWWGVGPTGFCLILTFCVVIYAFVRAMLLPVNIKHL